MDHKEKPGTPGDILEHYGKKGMHWGVVNEDDTSAPERAKREAQRNEEAKRAIAEVTLNSPKKDESSKSRLSPAQKKAILVAGVGVVAVGGFLAYKHYAGSGAPKPHAGELTDWGNPMPKKEDMSALKTKRLSDKPLGALGKDSEMGLFRHDKLTLNTTNGYADWLPKDGFANEHVKARHDSTVRALEAFREKYPSVRNMNIEVAPLSHKYRDARDMSNATGVTNVLGKGEARLYYDDVSGYIPGNLSDFVPGFRDPDHLGTHEMGHILAAANGSLMSRDARLPLIENAMLKFKELEAVDDIRQAESGFHKKLFEKHGTSFEELSKLGGYAATEPAEALAELSATFHSPNLRAKMDPDLAKRAEAMFNEMGGLT